MTRRTETQAHLCATRGIGRRDTKAVAALKFLIQQDVCVRSEVCVLTWCSGTKSTIDEVDGVLPGVERGGRVARRVHPHRLSFDIDPIEVEKALEANHVKLRRLSFSGDNGGEQSGTCLIKQRVCFRLIRTGGAPARRNNFHRVVPMASSASTTAPETGAPEALSRTVPRTSPACARA